MCVYGPKTREARLNLLMVNVVGCNMEININRFSFEHFLINLLQYLQNASVTFEFK